MGDGSLPTVLVIEDERELADAYAQQLRDRYDVRVAYDGESALSKLDADVEVAILDRRMSGLSGDEVLARIRGRGLNCRVAIVSAVEPDFDVVGMGFDDYLTKPVGREALADVIEKLRRRNEYTDLMQEYFSLVAKRAILDEVKSPMEREASRRYAELSARIGALEETVSAVQRELLAEQDVEVAFRDLARNRCQ